MFLHVHEEQIILNIRTKKNICHNEQELAFRVTLDLWVHVPLRSPCICFRLWEGERATEQAEELTKTFTEVE